MSENHHQHIDLDDEGRLVATADLQTDPQSGVVCAQLHVEPGHQRPGTGGRLVDAVLARVASREVVRLVATLPAGEAEVLERLRERCPDVRVRPAGATVIAEGNVPGS